MEIEEAIAQLNQGIRRLKVQYDTFFAGGRPRPPVELRAELERLIRRFANSPIRRYSDRFHFNSLVGRYNSFVELWNKQTRAIEEGRDPSTHRPIPSTAPKPAVPADVPAERVLCSLRISNPVTETDGLRVLFEQYLTARQQRDGVAPKLSIESFVRQISRQVESLKASTGCSTVEFRLTNLESQVTIKARPAAGSGPSSGPGEPDEETQSRQDEDTQSTQMEGAVS